MSRPWMPLYVADYLADTAHLSAAESGAYLHLIMHYWLNGSLPSDDRLLSRIAKMTAVEWRRARPILQAFFHDGWRHKRVDIELAKAADISSKRRASAVQRGSKTDANVGANAELLHTHARASSPSQSPSVPNGTGAAAPPDPKAELFRRGREILGNQSGGLIAKLLKSFGNEDDPKAIAHARARIEEASTKAKPNEWLGRVLQPKPGEFQWASGIEGVQ